MLLFSILLYSCYFLITRTCLLIGTCWHSSIYTSLHICHLYLSIQSFYFLVSWKWSSFSLFILAHTNPHITSMFVSVFVSFSRVMWLLCMLFVCACSYMHENQKNERPPNVPLVPPCPSFCPREHLSLHQRTDEEYRRRCRASSVIPATSFW